MKNTSNRATRTNVIERESARLGIGERQLLEKLIWAHGTGPNIATVLRVSRMHVSRLMRRYGYEHGWKGQEE